MCVMQTVLPETREGGEGQNREEEGPRSTAGQERG